MATMLDSFYRAGYSETWDSVEPTQEELDQQEADYQYRTFMQDLRRRGVYDYLNPQDAPHDAA